MGHCYPNNLIVVILVKKSEMWLICDVLVFLNYFWLLKNIVQFSGPKDLLHS